jgi:type II secretory ATPase GspE/PulE/Tfp pilus assembly ATPase PilB-like protein
MAGCLYIEIRQITEKRLTVLDEDKTNPEGIHIPESLRNYVFAYNGAIYVSKEAEKGSVFANVKNFLFIAKRKGFTKKKTLDAQDFNRMLGKIKASADTSDDQNVTVGAARDLFYDAVKKRASDIHVRVYEHNTQILYRIDGDLEEQKGVFSGKGQVLINSIYGYLADQADSTYQPRKYQDARIGRAEFLPEGVHGIRIASGPHDRGVCMVLRLLYEDTGSLDGTMSHRFESLGYNKYHTRNIMFMRKRPAGIIIISGPTGSGKSTTLKHALESLHKERPELNILTVEDPPEYPMDGVVQMPVTNADSAETRNAAFSSAMRSALRSDPDVIMVGEIRDSESARLAIRAAMTGHQVWTTVHANDAFHIINRMADIMVCPEIPKPINTLADSTVLVGLVAQRLLRSLCPHCKRPLLDHQDKVPKDTLGRLSQAVDLEQYGMDIYIKGEGCSECGGRGTYGRSVIAETVVPDPHMLKILREEGVDAGRSYWLKQQGGKTMMSHAVDKITEGTACPVDVESIVGPLTMESVFEDGKLEEGEYEQLAINN